MAISGLPNQQNDWTVEVNLFSGRPNPAWRVTDERAREFLQIWNALPSAPGQTKAAQSTALGYRGCILTGPGEERWLAVDGVVTHFEGGVTSGGERRADPARRLEHALMNSAPPGELADSLREVSRVWRLTEPE